MNADTRLKTSFRLYLSAKQTASLKRSNSGIAGNGMARGTLCARDASQISFHTE